MAGTITCLKQMRHYSDRSALDTLFVVLTNLRRISVIEAVSYVVLIVAAIVKRTGGTELGVTIMGPVHGILFLVFAAMVLKHFNALGWPLWKAITGIFIGSLPLGGFYVDRRWLAPLAASGRHAAN